MTDLRPDDHDETRVAAMPEEGRTFMRCMKETADAMPVPTLAQLQDAVGMLTPAETDEIIREGEDIEFGYAALELAQGLLDIGHVQHAIRWLRAAADRDIPGAEGQLDEATRRHGGLTDAVHVRHRGQAAIGIASTHGGGAEGEQAGLLKGSESEAADIRSAEDTAARIIGDAHVSAERIIAETRASREHTRDRLHHATDLLSPKRFTDTALPIVVHAPPGTGKTRTLADIVSRSIARGERCLVVANSYSVAEEVLRRLDRAAAPRTTSCDNTAETMEAWLWSAVETLWYASSSLDLNVKEALTSWARPAAPWAEQSERNLLLAAAVLESAPAAVRLETASMLARQTAHEIADLIGPSGELIHVKQEPFEAVTNFCLPNRRLPTTLELPSHSTTGPQSLRDA